MLVVQVYSQKPPTHCCGALPWQSVVVVQFGVGRVSGSHAPWLQYWPLGQVSVAEHCATHVPPAQTGVPDGHWELDVHVVPLPFGTHAPFTHDDPVAHDVAEHAGRHWPSSHTSPDGHWLEYWQAFDEAVQTPPTQTWPVAHSVFVVHAHGPSAPPHVGPESCPASTPAPDDDPEDDPEDEPEEDPDDDPDEEPEDDPDDDPEDDPDDDPDEPPEDDDVGGGPPDGAHE